MSLTDFMPLPAFRRLLAAVVDVLHVSCPEAHLFHLLDWHEHDGYVKEATPATWWELEESVAFEEALQRASMGDTFVRTAWFPETRDFLLRFYVPAAEDNPFHDDDPRLVHYGIFDVTAQEPLSLQVQAAAQEAGGAVGVLPAKAFFDNIYGG